MKYKPHTQNHTSPPPLERSRYDAELEARARYHENSGEPEIESWQLAEVDLGSFEHQQWLAGYSCNCFGCARHIEALERINRTLAVECDRLQAQLKAVKLHGRDRRAA